MKVLLVAPWQAGSGGGVMRVVESLAADLHSHGHEVKLFHPGKAVLLKRMPSLERMEAVELRITTPFGAPRPLLSTLAFPFLFPIVLFQLVRHIRTEHIGIINLHYPMDPFFYFAICGRLLSIPLVTSLHGNDAFDNFGKPKAKYSWAFRFILRNSNLIVLPSNAYRKRLLSSFRAIADRTITIHNGINTNEFRPSTNVNTAKTPYILCVGDHRPYKGIDVLLHGFSLVATMNPEVNLVLAGDGPLRNELERLAHGLGIRDRVQFVGTRQSREIADLLRGCEVFVLPSRAESFGIAIVEAMACRKPIVATAVGGVPEVVEHGKSAILVEPENPTALAEALNCLLKNNNLSATLADNAYSRAVEHFYFARAGSQYEHAFASLLNETSH